MTLRELVNPRFGVIRTVQRLARGPHEPTPPLFYQATLAHFDYRQAEPEIRTGTGRGFTDDDAIAGAIGEAMERYCAAQPDLEAFVRMPFAEVTGDAIAPPDGLLFSDAQYDSGAIAYPRFNPAVPIPWIEGRRLRGDRPVLIATSLVYLDYTGNHEEAYFCAPTSSGLGAGATRDDAILSALLELVERDAFLITWLHRLPVPEIDVAALRGHAERIVRTYRRGGVKVRAFALATELPVHAVMAVLLDTTGAGPAAVIGLGCSLAHDDAVLRALCEASQSHPGLVTRCAETHGAPNLSRYEDVRALDDHASFFFSAERLAELAFLLEPPVRAQPAAAVSNGVARADKLRVLVDALGRAGYDPAYVDVTTPDLAGYPLHVVRALVPGLQPIHFGYGQERLGGARLFDMPRRLGYAGAMRTEADINRCPHPLA
jgi:ribosomal protein S12 methylthiotransferase accessory factor